MKRLVLLMLIALGFAVGTSYAQWTEIPQLPAVLNWPMTAELNGTFYVFGGVGTAGSTAVYTYTPGDVAWKTLSATMPKGKFAGYAAPVGNKIYIVGGMVVSGSSYVTDNTTYEFDPAAGTFTAKKAIPTKVGFSSGASVGGKIYLIGGAASAFSGSDINVVQIYDPATDTWANGTSTPPFSTRLAATAVLNGNIYVMGGLANDAANFSTETWKGTPTGTDITWEQKSDLPDALMQVSGGAANGKLVFTGGSNNNAPIGYSNTYVYDPATDAWSTSYALPVATFNGGQMFGTGNDLMFAGGYLNQRAFKFTVSSAQQPSAMLTSNPVFVNLGANQLRSLPFTAQNLGVLPLTVKITIPDSAKNWLSAAADLNIDPLNSDTYTLILSSGTMSPGLYKATITIVTNDPDHASIPVNVALYVLPSTIKTQATVVVLEEGTGNWCGYCPQGAEVAQSIKDNLGDAFIALEYHGGPGSPSTDPMSITTGAKLIGDLGLQGFPNAAIQRWWFPGEAYQMTNRGVWPDYAQRVLDQNPDAAVSITIKNYTFDPATRKMHADLELQRSLAMVNDANTTIHLTTVVTEDQLDGQQEDYRLPSPYWTDYHWDDIVRQISPSEYGAVVSFPTPTLIDGTYITPGDKVTMSVDLTAPTTIKDSLQNCNVTFLVNQIQGTSTLGSILQAQRRPLMQAPDAVEPNPTNAFALGQNYPNPVSSETKLTYSIGERAPVTLSIYDILGREVARVVNATEDAGTYNLNFDASKLTSGTYTYVLNVGGKTIEKTMTVTK